MTVGEMKTFLNNFADHCNISLSITKGKKAYETSLVITDETKHRDRTILREVLCLDECPHSPALIYREGISTYEL